MLRRDPISEAVIGALFLVTITQGWFPDLVLEARGLGMLWLTMIHILAAHGLIKVLQYLDDKIDAFLNQRKADSS